MSLNIAIDGPAGAGKSTIARKVAEELGYVYVDTGAMYRAMGLYLERYGITYELAKSDPEKFQKEAAEKCQDADISIEYRDGEQVVLLSGENVNPLIRTEEAGNMASVTSKVPKVREKLVDLQRQIAGRQNVVMDGRDIGTVVLPDAAVKVYLTASSKVRARRRYLENLAKKKAGEELDAGDTDLSLIEKDIIARDRQDMERPISPLKQAEDAVLVDSSDMTVDQVVETILNLVAVKKNSLR